MYNNIGGKIKKLAAVLMVIGVLISLVSGIAMMSMNDMMYGRGTITGLLTIALGAVGSWAGSFVLYGFGELIERVQSIDNKTRNDARAPSWSQE